MRLFTARWVVGYRARGDNRAALSVRDYGAPLARREPVGISDGSQILRVFTRGHSCGRGIFRVSPKLFRLTCVNLG
ncbi:hypothetical protein BCAR13_410055 [Paraburkholderia caribensis]|nr:hypothetical protein BCAR13_410055 [Paraburkholderia caribensis]